MFIYVFGNNDDRVRYVFSCLSGRNLSLVGGHW